MSPGPIYIIRNTFPTLLYALLFSALNYSENKKNIFTSLDTQLKPKNIITASYLFYCINIYFTVLHIIFTFIYIHTLCLITTRQSWGHKNEELFCRLLEEERQELFLLFSENSILPRVSLVGKIYSCYNTLHLESQVGTLA
jgi:hypothetical protein